MPLFVYSSSMKHRCFFEVPGQRSKIKIFHDLPSDLVGRVVEQARCRVKVDREAVRESHERSTQGKRMLSLMRDNEPRSPFNGQRGIIVPLAVD